MLKYTVLTYIDIVFIIVTLQFKSQSYIQSNSNIFLATLCSPTYIENLKNKNNQNKALTKKD